MLYYFLPSLFKKKTTLFSLNLISMFCLKSMRKRFKSTQWPSLPFLSRRSVRPVLSARPQTPVFRRDLLGGHPGHLYPVDHLGLSSSKLRSWSCPFTLKRLLGHNLFSSSLLLLFNLCWVCVEAEVGCDLLWVFMRDGAMHAHNFLGQHPSPQTHWVSAPVAGGNGNAHRAQSWVCVTQGSGRQVNVRGLCERLVGSPRIRNHWSLHSQKAAWIWWVPSPGVTQSTIGVASGQQQTSAQLGGQDVWRTGHWR